MEKSDTDTKSQSIDDLKDIVKNSEDEQRTKTDENEKKMSNYEYNLYLLLVGCLFFAVFGYVGSQYKKTIDPKEK